MNEPRVDWMGRDELEREVLRLRAEVVVLNARIAQPLGDTAEKKEETFDEKK